MKPNLEFKKSVIEAFIAHFERELAALIQSAQAAHQAATHEESRAEDRHDTFAIEASYLAAGQAARVADLRAALSELRGYGELQRTTIEILPGSLVVLESEGKQTFSLISRMGGGTQIRVGLQSVTLLSPSSPVGEHLTGLSIGDDFNVDSKSGSRDYEVIAVV